MTKARKHPNGLYILFFTEMWERFGFYLMLGIFTLYMIAGESEAFPGLGMSNAEAADIYGSYLALVYLTPFIGGLLADRILGYRRSIYIGGALMAAGYLGLSVQAGMLSFYLSLLLIILGNGMFKPNISVLLGKLYETPEFEDRKDAGFNIFYMGINIGAFVCNFVAAYLRLTYGWGWAFAAAGIGMLVGLVWFAFGNIRVPEIKEADVISKKRPGDKSIGYLLSTLLLPAFVAAAVGWIIPGNFAGSDSTDAFIFFCLPVLIFFLNIYRSAESYEKPPIAALLSIFGVVIIFWAVFHQNGSALTYWANYNTDRQLSSGMAKVVNTISGVEEVSTVPRMRQETGLHGEDLGQTLGMSYYFDNYQGELPKGNLTGKPLDVSEEDWAKIAEDERKAQGKLTLWPTELQASINPFFVVILTPLVVGFFSFLRSRKKEPSTPGKITWGMLISAISWIIMVIAAVVSGNGLDKASTAWLFGIYGVITVGELCLSPMGLSLVSKIAPKRLAALLMGGWFLATAIGNKLSGVLSGLWDLFDNKSNFFLVNAGLTFGAFLIILVILPWLRRVYNETVAAEKKV
jgi:POT family proton-dependent oligopeptide transporter